ncbi:hypothetical protein [Thermofilum pendens]|uniref:Uncharacterized protein n=1 Tax=Thermofilum pendens (strain DSM 2475 / Hrk 5) TaxID=368408 RepID=A1RXD0_THEPD|nr:hypothetical protein [Thermofilum pendens]ABL77860.1 hypothetical protein Tpen_0451 [Thermofilum pendens Hrk 5]
MTVNKKALVLVAVAVLTALAAYIALLATPPAQPPVQPPTQTPAQGPAPAEKPRNATLTLKVYGPGSLLVNGTGYVNATLTLRAPAVLAINASPQPGWRLKALLVNGSPVLPGVARVSGDTTVEAVFAWSGPVVTLRVYGSGYLLVNGSSYGNDTLLLRGGALLSINASTPRSWRLKALLVNGSPTSPGDVRVYGNTTIEAFFEQVKVKVKVVPGEHPVTINGSWVNSTTVLEVPAYSVLVLGPASVELNETCEAVHYWNASVAGRWTLLHGDASLEVANDTVLVAGWSLKCHPPRSTLGGVLYAGREVKARMVLTVKEAQSGSWRYKGNGVWEIEAPGFLIVLLETPKNWSKVVVKGKPLARSGIIEILVIVENGPSMYRSKGAGLIFEDISYFEFVLPRCIMQGTCDATVNAYGSFVNEGYREHWGPRLEPPPVEPGWLEIQVYPGTHVEIQVFVEP